MSAYTATARRQDRWWIVEVDGVGVTQGRNVADAQEMAADLVAAMTEMPAEEIVVDVTFTLPSGIEHEIDQARHANERAVEAQNDAAKRIRAAVGELKHVGIPGRDIAALLHISEQRVSQLAKH